MLFLPPENPDGREPYRGGIRHSERSQSRTRHEERGTGSGTPYLDPGELGVVAAAGSVKWRSQQGHMSAGQVGRNNAYIPVSEEERGGEPLPAAAEEPKTPAASSKTSVPVPGVPPQRRDPQVGSWSG